MPVIVEDVLLYLHCLADRGCIKRKVSELLEELGGHNGVECQAKMNKKVNLHISQLYLINPFEAA